MPKSTIWALATLFLSVLAGTLVYANYPVPAEAGVGALVMTADAGGDVPGFAVGAAGVAVLGDHVRIKGAVVGHAMLTSDGIMIPVLLVKAGGRNYTVVMGEESLAVVGDVDADIVWMPGMMRGMQVEVEGYMVRGSDIIVAYHVSMECPHMGACHMGERMWNNWEDWPRHGGWEP